MDSPDYSALLSMVADLEKKLYYCQNFDSLTGLYNKEAFYQKSSEILRAFPMTDFYIIYIDIERFKLVNDFYGTLQGNHLLEYLAQKLNGFVSSESCCLGRSGADTFVLLAPFVSLTETAGMVKAIYHFFSEYPLDMEIRPAIGLYRIQDFSIPISLMCDRAALASRSIKGKYTTHAVWYTDSMRSSLVEQHDLINGLGGSLANGEFEVYIQPKCNMRTGKIVGGEALVRWHHPQKGMIPPGDFIPFFEQCGFIKNLDQYVWEETAKWLQKRQTAKLPLLPISVNISRIDIFSIDVCGFFEKLVEKYGLDYHLIELEITESAYTDRIDEVIEIVNKLRAKGFIVLMDDFGSGYSSLNILKDIRIDVLKLDMRFLDSTDKRSNSILESVIRMARWMNLRVLAEGVENQEQIDFLLGIGCTYAQGFYYYRPMPIQEFEALFETKEKIDLQDNFMQEEFVSSVISLRDFLSEDILSEIILNNILGIVVLYSYDGETVRFLRGNLQYYQTLHPHALLGSDVSKDVVDAIHIEDRPIFFNAIKQALSAGDKGTQITVRRYSDAGSINWFQIKLFYLSENKGISNFYACITDVSDYMHAIENRRISEERFRIAIESSRDVIFEVDIASRTAKYSPQAQILMGLNQSYVKVPEGLITAGAIPPEYEKDFRQMYEAVFQGQDRASCTIPLRLNAGRISWIRITLTTIWDETGKPVKAVGLARDVSKEKEMEQQLQLRS